MKKKFFDVFVALCLVLSILPMSAFAAGGQYEFYMPGINYDQSTPATEFASSITPAGSGSAVFNGPAKTLTLTNFNYSSDGFMGPTGDDAVIHFVDDYGEIDGDFTIIFYGKNVIKCTTPGDNTIFDSLDGGELVLQAGDANSTLELISDGAPSPYGGKPTLGSNTVLTVNEANRMVFERRTGHEHMWGYNMQYDAAAHWDHCHVCGAKNEFVSHSDPDGNGLCICGWVIANTPARTNPDTGVTAEMLGR